MPREATKLIVDHRETIDEVARRNPRTCTTSVVASVIHDDNGMLVVYATTSRIHDAHITDSIDIFPGKEKLSPQQNQRHDICLSCR